MLNIVPGRYAEAKWQAYVTPDKNAFVFESGRKVKSLYDLKVALTEEGEDIIMNHLHEGTHDIANWVEFMVGDKELADAMRKYTHRWGLIVALERHMMRSLSIPHYVAKRWLQTTDITFTFVSGQTVASLEQLASVMQGISDETLDFHRERVPNDVSKWMMDIIGDYQLAELIEEASNRLQVIHFIEDHIEMLRESAQS